MPLHSELNDPAEGAYRIAQPLIGSQDGKWYAPEAPILIPDATVRILSFSEDPKHPLMWSHYADSHHGICIGIRRAVLSAAKAVRYPSRVPRLEAHLTEQEKLNAAFLTKRAAWNYEREWRIVETESTRCAEAYLPLPQGAITEVIFGVRTSEDDRAWVKEWLSLTNCAARVRQATFSGAHGRIHLVSE